MSNFNDLNNEITTAHALLEGAVHRTIAAEGAVELAEIALIQAKSAKVKARLELKLAQDNMDSLKEKSWNLRASVKLGG